MASGTFYASARIAATTAAPPPSAHPLAVIKPRHPDLRWSAVGVFLSSIARPVSLRNHS